MADTTYKLNPKVGDYAVFTWRGKAVEITKVTDKTLSYTSPGWKRDTRVALTGIAFTGPKDIADKLAEKLKSSSALCSEERRNSELRRAERDRKLIEDAASAVL